MRAGAARRSSTLGMAPASSTETPIHRFGGQSSLPAILGSREDRLVRT